MNLPKPGDVYEFLDEVIAVRQKPTGGTAEKIPQGARLEYVQRIGDFLEFESEAGDRCRVHVTNLHLGSLRKAQGAQAPKALGAQNNDGRTHCFDASCGGKTKRVEGILSVYNVCTRCGK